MYAYIVYDVPLVCIEHGPLLFTLMPNTSILIIYCARRQHLATLSTVYVDIWHPRQRQPHTLFLNNAMSTNVDQHSIHTRTRQAATKCPEVSRHNFVLQPTTSLYDAREDDNAYKKIQPSHPTRKRYRKGAGVRETDGYATGAGFSRLRAGISRAVKNGQRRSVRLEVSRNIAFHLLLRINPSSEARMP